MYYPDEKVQEVRDRSDIVSVVSRYVSLTRRGNNYFGLCPFHSEKTPSFSVNAPGQFFHCFGCGVGGNVFTFLQRMENITFPEALEQLAEEAHIELPQTEMSPEEKARIDRREKMRLANRDAARFFYMQLTQSPYAQQARDYLDSRKVTTEYLKKFGLGYAPISRNQLCRYLMDKGYSAELLKSLNLIGGDNGKYYDRFFNRVMFPIFDVRGNVIAFGGRVIGKGEPKYLNSSDTELFNKRKNLYAMNIAKRSRRKEALLVEGYMDVFSLHQAGFDNAVASLGTSLTSEQAMLIRRYFEEVCVVYDSDAAGTNAARRAVPILEQAGLKVRVMQVPGNKDPDDYIKANGHDAFEQLIETAMDPVSFELSLSNMNTVDGRVEALRTMKDRLMRIQDDSERQIHIRDVASRLQIDPDTLAREVEEARRSYESADYWKARDAVRPKGKEPGGIGIAECQILALMVRFPAMRRQMAERILETDFPEEDQIVRTAFRYLKERPDGKVLAGDLFNLTEDEKEQDILSRVLAVQIPENTAELSKFAAESVRVIRGASLDRQLRECQDIGKMQNLIIQKKQLERLETAWDVQAAVH